MSDTLAGALLWLDGQQSAMERLLAELVDLSSHTADVAGCGAVAGRLLSAFAELGGDALTGRLVPSASDKYGPHLALASRHDAGAVLLVGHHDTVFPKATFAGFREDGALLRGPGVLDMKGGLVVVGFALAALRQAGVLGAIPLRIVSISDEEVGSPEGRHLILQEARHASSALVFESGRSGDEIVTRRKGLGSLRVVAHGKAAHAGNKHEEGINAIWALARYVDEVQRLTDYGRGITINVGKIEGGIGKNTVPDRAEALVDFRFITAPDGESLVKALHDAATRASQAVAGARIEVNGGTTRHPLEPSAASGALLAEYAACAAASGLGSKEAPLVGGGSDANTVAAVGLPAIDGLGPRGKGFHTVDEMIERHTLIPKAAALVRFLHGRQL